MQWQHQAGPHKYVGGTVEGRGDVVSEEDVEDLRQGCQRWDWRAEGRRTALCRANDGGVARRHSSDAPTSEALLRSLKRPF